MAIGDTLLIWTPAMNDPPASVPATFDLRNGHPVLDFDASTDEEAVFAAVMPRNYTGLSSVRANIYWAASTATSGTCRWQAAFERIDEAGQDIDSDGFASFQSAGSTAPGTSGQVRVTSIDFSPAQADSLAAGEAMRFKARRDADGTSGTDDMTGDAELLRIELQEVA